MSHDEHGTRHVTRSPDGHCRPTGTDGAGPKVVALGGGHGLSATLSALRRVTDRLTAVVTVADDGGSSGRLRREFGVLPPGDLRMALAALCGDGDWGRTWSRVVQHRFSSTVGTAAEATEAVEVAETARNAAGPPSGLHGHALGNLLIVTLWELLGDTVAGLRLVGELLGAHGTVLPAAAVPLDIAAEVVGADPARPTETSTVRGQVECATTPGRVREVSLVPADPPAVPEAVAAISDADWVVLGPGSWFTSVLPHLLVPELARAIASTQARRLVALNLAPQPGETDDFTPDRHLDVLAAHAERYAPGFTADVVLADSSSVPDRARLGSAVASFGGQLAAHPVASADGTPRHDPNLLAAAYAAIFRAHGGGGKLSPAGVNGSASTSAEGGHGPWR